MLALALGSKDEEDDASTLMLKSCWTRAVQLVPTFLEAPVGHGCRLED